MGPERDVDDEEETIGYLCALFVIVLALCIVGSAAQAIKAGWN